MTEKMNSDAIKQIDHIAIILDGNRRFAKAQNKKPWQGHTAGADKVEEFLNWCKELGIKETTPYMLSTENLNRNPEELKHLFNLFRKFFKKFKDSKEIHENKVKIKFIGDLSLIPSDIKQLAEQIQENTKDYDNYKLNFCFAYGGRLEIVNAFNKLSEEKAKNNKGNQSDITEQDITNALWLKSEPQFIIRTGGHNRTSNFLPWQSVYSEWIFLDKLWPEFTKQDLIQCIEKFNSTQRNFGK